MLTYIDRLRALEWDDRDGLNQLKHDLMAFRDSLMKRLRIKNDVKV